MCDAHLVESIQLRICVDSALFQTIFIKFFLIHISNAFCCINDSVPNETTAAMFFNHTPTAEIVSIQMQYYFTVQLHDSEPAPMKWTFWMTTSLCNDRFCGQLTTYYMSRRLLIFTYSSSNKFAMRSVCPWAQIVWMQENGLENQTECAWKWKSLTQLILVVSKKKYFLSLKRIGLKIFWLQKRMKMKENELKIEIEFLGKMVMKQNEFKNTQKMTKHICLCQI